MNKKRKFESKVLCMSIALLMGTTVISSVAFATSSEQSDVKADSEQSDVKADSEQSDVKADSEQSDVKADSEQSDVKADSEQSDVKADSEQLDVKTGGVEINEINFPDSDFRSYVATQIDKNSDGELSLKEKNDVTKISFTNAKGKFKNVKGIENFTELQAFTLNYGALEFLDVSQNTKLTDLRVSYNKLKELDVSKNKELNILEVSGNKLTSLDLSWNTKLKWIQAMYNNLAVLDLTGVPIDENAKKGGTSAGTVINQSLYGYSILKRSENEYVFNMKEVVGEKYLSRVKMIDGTPINANGEVVFSDIAGLQSKISYYFTTGSDMIDLKPGEYGKFTVRILKSTLKYLVTFEDGSGNVLKTEIVADGESATAPEVSDKEDCTFEGWNQAFDKVNDVMIIKAKWKATTEPTPEPIPDTNQEPTPEPIPDKKQEPIPEPIPDKKTEETPKAVVSKGESTPVKTSDESSLGLYGVIGLTSVIVGSIVVLKKKDNEL